MHASCVNCGTVPSWEILAGRKENNPTRLNKLYGFTKYRNIRFPENEGKFLVLVG